MPPGVPVSGGLPAFTHGALVKGANAAALKTGSCFRTSDLTADSEPSRTLTGSGEGGEVRQLRPEVTPREMGCGHYSQKHRQHEGPLQGRGVLRCRRWDTIWEEQSPRRFLGHIST